MSTSFGWGAIAAQRWVCYTLREKKKNAPPLLSLSLSLSLITPRAGRGARACEWRRSSSRRRCPGPSPRRSCPGCKTWWRASSPARAPNPAWHVCSARKQDMRSRQKRNNRTRKQHETKETHRTHGDRGNAARWARSTRHTGNTHDSFAIGEHYRNDVL